jgi:cyclic pyranopterin phosphate synthase
MLKKNKEVLKDTNLKFTHLDSNGSAIMVNVSEKKETFRVAVARGQIKVGSEIMEAIINQKVKKGDVLSVARVAGIMATKKTSDLIPLCHPIPLTDCSVDFDLNQTTSVVTVTCKVSCVGRTGVEMEALTGVTASLLSVYDMCKALDKSMVMGSICLLEKTGGKSGSFSREMRPPEMV